MCLGIPGQIVEITDPLRHLALVDVSGVRRTVNIACIVDADHPPQACLGDWVLVHVGFAMSRIDADEAARTLALLTELGEAQVEIEAIRASISPGERKGMKYVDEFRDPVKARALAREIEALMQTIEPRLGRPLQIMEVCGGHTHSIFRYGIAQMLPESVEFVHGPGCPVCVLPMGRVDDCIALAEQPQVIFTTFGDAMRVPGSTKSLLQAKAGGADVRMVYSPLDALRLAQENPDREVVFFGLGFETTMPGTAMTVLQARADKVRNFSLFCNHITIIPTIRAILDSPDLQLDGFLGPGHVSMVIGTHCYDFIARDYKRPITVAGFEPLDVLHAVAMVIRQIAEGRCEVENQYRRIVPENGNAQALAAIAEVFEPRAHFEWRGLGSIAHSGVRLRQEFAAFDAERRFAVPNLRIADPQSCQCGEVLKGVIRPRQCQLFGTACTPETPLGALMVSSEGACAATYNYGRIDTTGLRRSGTDKAVA